jgi:hypothetical protein
MRKFTLLLAIVALLAALPTKAQTPGTKGNGQTFYSESFGWYNPADDKGWTAAEGYYFLDPNDQGTNFVWWPPETGFVSVYTQDPPLNSTTKDDGCIANFIEGFNWQTGTLTTINVDNSVGFPTFDCSAHSSVVVSFETHFMAYSVADMFLEISVDNWVHAASYSTAFGCGHKDRPLDKAPGEPALFKANVSDVAAGMTNVQMRLHWLNTYLYYWAFDDFKLSEAYNNDMRMQFAKMEWDDNDPNTTVSWFGSLPKSQLDGSMGYYNWISSATNFGEYDQENVYMDLNVIKGGNNVFNATSEPRDVYTLVVDTATIADKYSPTEYGHYRIDFTYKQKEADDNPADNSRSVFFNVSDSVFSRSGDVNMLSWSLTKETYTTEATENIDHFAGSIFPIYADCEMSSVSVYLTGGKADENLNYRFAVWFQPPGEVVENSFEIMSTDYRQLDSADFNTWVTMELWRDGESEFLHPGDVIYVGISQDNTNPDYLDRRNKGLSIGTDNTVGLYDTPTIAIYDGTFRIGNSSSDYVGKRNLMIHLNLNDHGNLIDGMVNNTATSSLGQNYPNPFRGNTDIDYELADNAEVVFSVMDLAGRKVMEVNEGLMPAGKHTFNLSSASLQPGVYFYTLRAGDFKETKQMVIVE